MEMLQTLFNGFLFGVGILLALATFFTIDEWITKLRKK